MIHLPANPILADAVDVLQWIHARTGLSDAAVNSIITSLIIIIVVLALRFLALRIVRRRITDVKTHYYTRRFINYAAGFIVFITLILIWITGITNLGTFLGLVSAGLAIALQAPLTDFAGWIFILTRRPFSVGDRIELGQHRGDVIDIRLFQTYMLECGNWVDADQSTGRIVMVPNASVFKTPTANYTRGFEHIWDEIPVLITFESDWHRAKQILTDIAHTYAEHLSHGAQQQIRQAAQKHMIFFANLTPIVYTTVKASGVMLTIRYLTLPRTRRGSRQRIWEAILDAFANESKIDLAYPTQRMYRNELEGKPATRPEDPT